MNTSDASPKSTQPKERVECDAKDLTENETSNKESLISCKYCGLVHKRSKKFCIAQTYCSFCEEAHSYVSCKKRLDSLKHANTVRNLEVLTSNILHKDQSDIVNPINSNFAPLQFIDNPTSNSNQNPQLCKNILSKLDNIINILDTSISKPPGNTISSPTVTSMSPLTSENSKKSNSVQTSLSANKDSILEPNWNSYTEAKKYLKQQQEKAQKSHTFTEPKILSPSLPPPEIITSTVSYDPYEFALKNGYLNK